MSRPPCALALDAQWRFHRGRTTMVESTTTRIALSEMTDDGAFEELMTAVLRRASPQFRGLIHTGVNERGQEIPAPVDGFWRIPDSNPALFVFAAHTITAGKELKRKWLSGDVRRPGDLQKAIIKADFLRSKFPDAKFLLALTTVRSIDVTFLTEIYAAAEGKIAVEVWDVRRIVDYLDNESAGQWLRKKYLNIAAHRLSTELARELGQRGLAMHAGRHLRALDVNSLITRQKYKELETKLNSGVVVVFLVGRSGVGKSVMAHQVLKDRLGREAAGVIVYCEPERLLQHGTPEELLDAILRSLAPELEPRAWTPLGPAVILIDDLSRANEPLEIVRRLLAWQKTAVRSSVTFVVPSTPSIWARVFNPSDPGERINQAAFVELGSYTQTEASVAIARLSNDSLRQLDTSELDPILIALRSRERDGTGDGLDRFVVESLERAAERRPGLLREDFTSTLDKFSLACLSNSKPTPTWTEVSEWLSEEDREHLRVLNEDQRLLFIETLSGDPTSERRVVFRHDRLRDRIFARMIVRYSGRPEIERLTEDPYWASVIAEAEAQSPSSVERTRKLVARNPLAALHLLDRRNTYELVKELRNWCIGKFSGGLLPSAKFAFELTMTSIRTRSILDITEGTKLGPLGLLARLAQGCAKSGVKHLARFDDMIAFGSADLDQAIAHGMKYRTQLLAGLGDILRTETEISQLRGALALAARIGDVGFEPALLSAWQNCTDREAIFSVTLWACLRCGTHESADLIRRIVEIWYSMSDIGKPSPRYRVAEQVGLALRSHPPREEPTEDLVRVLRANDEPADDLLGWLHRVDTPAAVVGFVRSRSERSNGGFRIRSERPRFSAPTRDAVAGIWKAQHEPAHIRECAFQIWCRDAAPTDLSELRAIPRDSALWEPAFWYRTKLGDRDVLPELRRRLSEGAEVASGLDRAESLWGSELRGILDESLAKVTPPPTGEYTTECSNLGFLCAQLMMKIPHDDASELLRNHWSRLGYIALFVQTALFHITPVSVRLANESLESCPDAGALLAHITFQFGFMDGQKRVFLTREHLRILEPYLDHLSKSDLESLAHFCESAGHGTWFDEFLSDRLDASARRRHRPRQNDILAHLEELCASPKLRTHASYWGRRWIEMGLDRVTIMEAVRSFLGHQPTPERLVLAADVVSSAGARADLAILTNFVSDCATDTKRHLDDASYWVRFCRPN